MTVEEQLKEEILSKYKSIRAFTTEIGIPYSTLDSVFKRGISNAGVSTMIKIFGALDLDIESVATGELKKRRAEEKPTPVPGDGLDSNEEALMSLVRRLTPDQQKLLLAWLKTALSQEQ